MSSRLVPRVSSHAELRFLQRTGAVDRSTWQSWQHGTPVDVDGYDYHDARYDDRLDVVLLSRDGVVTTVLRAAYAEFTERTGPETNPTAEPAEVAR